MDDMKNMIILLALIALIGAASGIALNDFKDDVKKDLDSNAINNETETSLTNSSTVGCTSVNTGTTYYILANATGMVIDDYSNWTYISSANMTIEEGGGITVNYPDVANNFSKVTYNCLSLDNAYNISDYGLNSLDNSTSYLDTIGTIIGVSILIGIVVLAFTFARR